MNSGTHGRNRNGLQRIIYRQRGGVTGNRTQRRCDMGITTAAPRHMLGGGKTSGSNRCNCRVRRTPGDLGGNIFTHPIRINPNRCILLRRQCLNRRRRGGDTNRLQSADSDHQAITRIRDTANGIPIHTKL